LGAIIGILAPMRPEKKFFVLAFPVFVAIGIASGIAFSNHYFIMAAPPLALLCGLAVRQAHRVFSGNSARETEAKEPPFSAANYLMLLFFKPFSNRDPIISKIPTLPFYASVTAATPLQSLMKWGKN
jgi:hypothetical protein